MNTQQTINDFGKPIYSYSRKQAILDGTLVDVTDRFPEYTNLFKYQVCFSGSLMQTVEGSNAPAWVWDICLMAAKGPGKMLSESKKRFQITLPLFPGSSRRKVYDLVCIVGPGDTPAPVVTICFPHQD